MISALPVSGACVPNTIGAHGLRPRISLINVNLTAPKPWPPSSGPRCGAHKPLSRTCCLSGSTIRRRSSFSGRNSQPGNSTSRGSTSSRTNSRIQSSFFSNSGSVEKSQLIRYSYSIIGGDPLRPAVPRLRSPRSFGGDPLRPAAPRLRSPRSFGGDPLRPAVPRLRSPRSFGGDPLRPAVPRLRSPRSFGGDPLRPAVPRLRSPRSFGGDPLRPAVPRLRSPRQGIPPSDRRIEPVVKLDASDAKNSAAPTISRGLRARFKERWGKLSPLSSRFQALLTSVR